MPDLSSNFLILGKFMEQTNALLLMINALELGSIDLHAGAHGGGNDAGADILALCCGRFALTTAPSSVFRFSVSFSAPKDTLPMGQWMMLVLSRRYSILPALISLTAAATFGVTVPASGRA